MKKKFFWAIALIVLLTLGGGLYLSMGRKKISGVQTQTDGSAAVQELVENFGDRLKDVSLLAPKDLVDQEIEADYGSLVTPDLLKEWKADPSRAPGRLTSSPWPEKIEIQNLQAIDESSYRVAGLVDEISSQEKTAGGAGQQYPVSLKVERMGGRWLISGFQGYPPLPAGGALEYLNTRYGFNFSLPESWKGYSIVTGTWEGYAASEQGDTPVEHGPLISIRHPAWTKDRRRQDIPIMVFTLAQWDSLLRDKFHVGAAPINPSRLGVNADYVFALPARYNFAFPTGFEEVEKILEGNPLRPLPSGRPVSQEGKLLLCGGIPDGSVENLTETTRLFVNLPKDVYPDKDHNLSFKTVVGDARANWISNAGPYGEAFEASPDCWSYYYEFDGKGEVDLSAKNSDYKIRFMVK